MLEALRTNFEQDEEMHQYLLECDKFGNNIEAVDKEAAEIAKKVSEIKGLEFKQKIFEPLFFNRFDEGMISPFYLYLNVTTPEMLRKVLANPKKYAPSGVYIVRIHGTFVNFLDLSPEIQEDIIKRLVPNSTSLNE